MILDEKDWSSEEESTPGSFLSKEFQHYAKALEKEKIMKAVMLLELSGNTKTKTRRPKGWTDHHAPWKFIEGWSESLFRRQFRMNRLEFEVLLNKCLKAYPGPFACGEQNHDWAEKFGNLSGGSIPLAIKLAITLRILAGASYLDMVWYGVSINSVHRIFHFMLNLIDIALPNREIFNMEYTPEALNKLASEWSAIMIEKRGCDLMQGTILAGDGLVVAINSPSTFDLVSSKVRDVTNFRNRKGCFAVVAQAFCDAFGQFRVFDVNWPGNTNDITAYKNTDLYHKYLDGKISDGYHIVLDEAYSSIGGACHLTPFTRAQLRNAREESEGKYLKMKSFNFFLSSQRITIERAFGMMVRKWGILWRPLEFPLQTNIQIIQLCAKLHNLCLLNWKAANPTAKRYQATAETKLSGLRDSNVFLRFEKQNFGADGDEIMISDDEIMTIMGNRLPAAERAAQSSAKKLHLMDNIFANGFIFTPSADSFFIDD